MLKSLAPADTNASLPLQLAGELFEQVQLSHIFPDSKTFVDALPQYHPELILAKFRQQRGTADFNLAQFISANFSLPLSQAKEMQADPTRNMLAHIHYLWDILAREPDRAQSSSLLTLPYPYIVPGGRFREVYYWDSYFTAEGLVADQRLDMVLNMVKNFAYLISTYGSIPNANRSYYLSRSQAPFFANLVEIIFREQGIAGIRPYLAALDQEYKFWMNGPRAVQLLTPEPISLNRYWDSNPSPRAESFSEDLHLAAKLAPAQRGDFFRHVRAACESGWDFSSRWLANSQDLASIQTTDILAVDLNAILFGMETKLGQWHLLNADHEAANYYLAQAQQRQQVFSRYFWNSHEQCFFDYNHLTHQQLPTWSLAALYPLFFKLATPLQAQAVAHHVAHKFLKPGGVVTTLYNGSEQWDSPNGWAPLQWITIIGLLNYGYEPLAVEIARRFIATVQQVFKVSAKIMEKYNVCDLNLPASGGEYALQDGFGWTNGVVQALLQRFPQLI